VTSPGPGPDDRAARSDEPAAGGDSGQSTRERLQAIFDRARASFAENLDTIDGAVSHLRTGALGETERRAAERAAHRLAGAAGTVGVPEATAPARQLEYAFADEPRPDQAEALHEQVATLRRILSGGSVSAPDGDEV
jgi:HPt (histidine-containing phosphotransfer) domain-containing protein